MDTKEKILLASLELFSKDGYEAVSVSMIADALGITKARCISTIRINGIYLTASCGGWRKTTAAVRSVSLCR